MQELRFDLRERTGVITTHHSWLSRWAQLAFDRIGGAGGEVSHETGHGPVSTQCFGKHAQAAHANSRIDTQLYGHLADQTPEELDELSSGTRVEAVTDVDFDSVIVSGSGVHARGRATVELELNYGGGEERDGLTTSASVPFFFDVVLGHDLHLREVVELDFDTSEFDGSDFDV